jgi:hypothetical protein
MRLILLFGVMMSLSSITSAQQLAAPPTVRFSEAAAYKVDATSVDIIVQDQTPREYPQVGHLAPTTFEQATRAWVAQRFQLTGNSVNTLRITLREGRITEKILPIEKGIRGWFKKEESVAYDGVLSLEVAIIDANGSVLSKAEALATVGRSLTEGATRADKDAIWIEMVKAAFDNADRELKARLKEYMSRYIN